MTAYAFWNNKGGVGKSFLCFVAATEYAHRHPESDVYVIDCCPQANVSEMLLGGYKASPKAIAEQVNKTPRGTIAGYLEARLNSPFTMIGDVSPYISPPSISNPRIPRNTYLVCGDNLLEVLADAIRQTSQLAIPVSAWRQVQLWIRDLVGALRSRSGERECIVILDCNPSFAIYTQLALSASDRVVLPFTADDSSRRGIENVIALLYGISNDKRAEDYARLSFAKRAKEDRLDLPKLYAFVSNRVTTYEGKASRAFAAVARTIKTTIDSFHESHRQIFSDPQTQPSRSFIEIPDYHSACVVASMNGVPIHKLNAGPKDVAGERVQLNAQPLGRYATALATFVDRL